MEDGIDSWMCLPYSLFACTTKTEDDRSVPTRIIKYGCVCMYGWMDV